MHRARFLIVLSLVSLALSALAALSLVPSYLALEIAAPPVGDTAISHTGTPKNDPTEMARAQAIIVALRPYLNSTTSPSAIVASALGLRTQGVTIDHITYVSGKSGQMTLDGTATREAISAYRDALGKNPYFSAVSVPVGSLVGAGGRFTLSLTGAF